METNELERRRWNDERWAALWPKRERLTDAVTPFVLDAAALRAGERVLDVGSGGGKLSIAASTLVGPDGAVVGADVSAPLAALAVQRARAAAAANVSFTVVDVQTGEVPGAPFDVVVSQFGVMFFDEPETAFANIHAHLKPDGRLAFACWQAPERNPWFFAPAIAELLPPPPALAPGKSPTGPFALADALRTIGILESAGFADVRRTTHELTVDAPPDSVVDDVQLTLMGAPDDSLEAIRAAIDRHMQQFVISPGHSRFPLAFQVFEARSHASGG